jgi:hypothetical protein
MKKLTKYGLISLALGLVLSTTLLFPAVLLKGLIEPIATLLWAAWRVITSVDQGIYWAALIAVYMILMILILPRASGGQVNPAYRHRPAPRIQVERWQALLQGASVGDEEGALLRDNLLSLLASTLGQERPLPPDELERELASKRISLSPAARAYLFPAATKARHLSNAHHARGAAGTPRWFRRWMHRAAFPDHDAVDELLQRMESIMEITDDK